MLEPWATLSALRRARVSRGLSLLRVSLATGIPAQKIGNAERLLGRLAPVERKLLANFYGSPEDVLFEEWLGDA